MEVVSTDCGYEEYWERDHGKYGVVVVYERYRRKNGYLGKSFVCVAQHPYTILQRCEICGFTSTPKKVQYRPFLDTFCLKTGDIFTKSTLCMSCWNKTRNLAKMLGEYFDNKRLLHQLKKEIDNANKA